MDPRPLYITFSVTLYFPEIDLEQLVLPQGAKVKTNSNKLIGSNTALNTIASSCSFPFVSHSFATNLIIPSICETFNNFIIA